MATNDPQALLRRLLREPSETEWLEFKHNNSDPEEIGRCVSACANASMLAGKDKAFMVWGIQDKTKRKLGTTVRLKDLKKGNENFHNWLSRKIEPRLMLEFVDLEEKGLRFSILVIEPSYDRPVSFSTEEYIRIGESIRPLKQFTEHTRTLWFITGKHKFENAIAALHQTEADVVQKLDIDVYYKLTREPQPKNKNEIIKKFIASEFIREDWEGGYDITNLGAVLFAKDMSIFPSVSNKMVRIIRYSGNDKRKSEGENEVTSGYAVAFSYLIKFVVDALPKEESYQEGVRRMVSPHSEVAIREFLANALIHQDFTISGAGPIIELYKNRIEITNPGNSLIERDRIIDERRSRNEKLAKAMRDLNLCEERGGGVDKAIIDIEEKFLPAPEFHSSETSMRIVMFGPKSFSSLSKSEKIWSCFCHCVVRWIRHEYMSNTTLRERFSLSTEQYQIVSSVISEAKKARRIIPADPKQGNKHAKYIPYWAGEEN